MLSLRQHFRAHLAGLVAFLVTFSFIALIPWKQKSNTFFPSFPLPSVHPKGSPHHSSVLPGSVLSSTISAVPTNPPLAVSTTFSSEDPQWLLGIFSPPSRFLRRSIIRSTWATRYSHPSYEYRFILGNYSTSSWAPLIDAENATYGDIWAIDDFKNETQETANTIKTMEFYKYMVKEQGRQVRRYEFVSKVDDDNWLNTPRYFDTFIRSRLRGKEKYDPKSLTMIGRPMCWGEPFAYATGRLYTVNWALLGFFAARHTASPRTDVFEDVLAGTYLYEDKVEHEFVPVEYEQSWDIGEELVNDETTMIHMIKHDERLLEISTIFDEHGKWNGKKISGLTNFNRTMTEVVDRNGEVSEEEMEQLRKEWESRNETNFHNPRDTLDWKLIRGKISIEDREGMGEMYPLNLPGNNASSGVVPQRLWDAHLDKRLPP